MIRLSDNLEINKPAPVDDRLGVFSSTASALAYIAEDRRYIGLTLIVDTGSGATEYWFENGVENADLVAKSGGGGGSQNLQQVTDEGNTTTNDLQLIDDAELIFGAGGGVLLDNGSRLREGTIDAETGGSKGIAQICGVGYELKWEAGSLYVMNSSGNIIREVRYKLTTTPTATDDVTKGFVQNSRWVLDNGDLYVCTDATANNAVWELVGFVPYTGATEDLDLGTHDLYTNKVYLYDEPNDNHGSIHYTDGDFHIEDADGHKLLVIEDGFMQLHLTDTIQSNLFTTNLTETRDHYLPDQSGTIALTSDLSGKVDSNTPITGATKTKITYDSKGLVTAGADLAIADLPTTVPYGFTAPIASIVSGGVITETQLTTVTIPAGAFKSGDNILITIWGTRTTGGASGVNSTISLRVTNTSGAQMMTNQTGNRHQNFTITGRVLSDTSIIWWQNSPTTSALTTTVPSLLNSGFTISIGLIRTNTTDEFTLYNAIVRKYS